MLKLSNAGKMPCKSWSLQARTTCPGSIDLKTKELVDPCKGCYATDGNYNFKNVKAIRDHNKQDWKRDEWVDDMVAELDNSRYFRWFDSGDVYCVGLAQKIFQVMQRTPWCKHWMPTRSHKFEKYSFIFKKMQALPNVVVRYSSDSITGGIIKGKTTSTIVQHPEDITSSMTLCEAYDRGGKCDTCRACWDKDVSVIAYPSHGRRMKKVYKDKNLIPAINVA